MINHRLVEKILRDEPELLEYVLEYHKRGCTHLSRSQYCLWSFEIRSITSVSYEREGSDKHRALERVLQAHLRDVPDSFAVIDLKEVAESMILDEGRPEFRNLPETFL